MAAPQVSRRQVSSDSGAYDSWDTWEELLLASAVKKHGTDKWGLVSAELQARASARNVSPSTFTPEACRSEYYAIRGRYIKGENREGNLSDDMPWFEELRKLRVAQLKRELEHFDSSIGFLEIKLKRLQSEREKSLQIAGKEADEIAIRPAADEYKAATPRSISSSDAFVSETCCRRSDCLVLESPAPADVSGSSELGRALRIEEECQRPEDILQGEEGKNICFERDDVSHRVKVECSDQNRYAQVDTGIIRGVADSRERSHSFQCEGESEAAVCLSNTNGVGGDITNSAKNLAGGLEVSPSSETQKTNESNAANVADDRSGQKSSDLIAANGIEVRRSPKSESGAEGRDIGRDDRGAKPLVLQAPGDVMDIKIGGGIREEPAKVETRAFQAHDSHSISGTSGASEGRLMPKFVVHVRTPFSTLDNNREGSETVNSPRLKQMFPSKHKRGTDGGTVLKPGSDKEACRSDDDHQTVICRERTVPERNHRMPIESADSTEDKQQEQVLSASETKKSFDEAPAVRKGKIQMLPSETASKFVAAEELVGSRNCVASTELVIDSKPSNSDVKNRSVTSTENSELREVWGESAEVVDDKAEPAKKRQRVAGWGKKRKSKKASTQDLASSIRKDAILITNPVEEACVKMESMTASHEGRDSMHDQQGKEADDQDTEAWHVMERCSGDSRVERSEVGSFVDGNEDISPMSRRNRRDPKVPGKLLPLLESLRTIAVHKFAPLFKHSQESQDNPRYDRLIRAHVDLGMIRARLEEGHYSGSLHFFRDLLLMVNNALVYYPRDTQEFVAATGLRECIVKEMEHVLETEALLKQRGPSIRKRDLKTTPDVSKASGQAPGGKEGRRKGIKRPAAKDSSSREKAMMKAREPSRVAAAVDVSGRRNLALGVEEATMPAECSADMHDLQMSDPNAQKSARNDALRGWDVADELRTEHPSAESTGEGKEARESESRNALNEAVTESKHREMRVDAMNPLLHKEGVLAKAGSVSEACETALNEGVAPKVHGTRAQKPKTAHAPAKRAAGRPPKHSQPQISQKPKESEVRRKWVKR